MVDGRRHVGSELESNNQLVVSSDCWTNQSLFGLQIKFVMMRELRDKGSCLLNDVCIINDDKDGLSSHDSVVEMAETIRNVCKGDTQKLFAAGIMIVLRFVSP